MVKKYMCIYIKEDNNTPSNCIARSKWKDNVWLSEWMVAKQSVDSYLQMSCFVFRSFIWYENVAKKARVQWSMFGIYNGIQYVINLSSLATDDFKYYFCFRFIRCCRTIRMYWSENREITKSEDRDSLIEWDKMSAKEIVIQSQ